MTTVTGEIEKQIHQFLIDNFVFDPSARIGPEDSLLESGIIDSTGVLELIMWLESTFGFTVEDQEVLPENLDSIRNIAGYIQRKLAHSLAAAS